MTFATPLALCGPLRSPAQMLADQEYGGHASIHDDAMAEKLGFRGAPIEGPTHFSLYAPLMEQVFGRAWFETGCISAHYQNMVIEGEDTRAFVAIPAEGAAATKAWVEKADGTPVHEASASIDRSETLLERRLAALRPHGPLVIFDEIEVGMTGARDELVRMDPDQHMGALYPFTLRDKLAKITENSPWYSDESPWGGPIIPLEMISVLAEYTSDQAQWPTKRGEVTGLFADQEIRLIDGPLLVGEDYLLRREVVALSESRRTESMWIRTKIFAADGERQVAEMLLNHAVVKESFEGYAELRAAREAGATA